MKIAILISALYYYYYYYYYYFPGEILGLILVGMCHWPLRAPTLL